MSEALAKGHRIEIRGFGSFSISRRPPRMGRNPRTGEQVLIPEKLVPHFKPGKALREGVDKVDTVTDAPLAAAPSLTPHTADSMRTLNWLWRGLLFFVLFAFALNNQHTVDLKWFLGYQWQAPMVFIVLAAFALGCATACWPWCPAGGANAGKPAIVCCCGLRQHKTRPARPPW